MYRHIRFLLAILGLTAAITALGQAPTTIPVTGNLGQIFGTPQPYSGVVFSLQNCLSPISIPGTSVIVQTTMTVQANASGLVNTNIWPNDKINCNGVTGASQYLISYVVAGFLAQTPQCYQAVSTAGSFNLNSAQPQTCSTDPGGGGTSPVDGTFANLVVNSNLQAGTATIGAITGHSSLDVPLAGGVLSGTLTAPLVNVTTGFQINGTAPSGHCAVGNGTAYVDAVCGSGSGTVGTGTVNQVAYYASGGTVLSGTSALTGMTVDGVTPTQFGFLDPTSSVQTQLNAKASSLTTVNGHQLIASFTLSPADVGAVAYTSPTVNAIPAVSGTTGGGTVINSGLSDDTANTYSANPFYMNAGFNMNPTNTATSGANYPSRAENEYVSYWNGTTAVSANSQHYLWSGSGTNPAVIEDNYYPAGLTTISVLYAQNAANVATSGANLNTPKFILRGATWTGSGSQLDDWSFQGVQGTGANPSTTLTFVHSGSSGNASVSVPGLIVTGTPLFESGVSTNSDVSGELTLSAATTASYTFANVYLVHPECWSRAQFDMGSGNRMWITYTSTTSMTINFATAVTGAVSFGCVGRS